VVAVVHFTILALVGQQSHDFGIRLGTGKDYLVVYQRNLLKQVLV
jgi:hypothetical protein